MFTPLETCLLFSNGARTLTPRHQSLFPPPVRRRYLSAYKAPSTTVENPLQISHFIQNKPNFPDAEMNVTSFYTADYENVTLGKRGKNKPNTNPIEPNLLDFQMNVSNIITKDYDNERLYRRSENKPNTKPNKPKTLNI